MVWLAVMAAGLTLLRVDWGRKGISEPEERGLREAGLATVSDDRQVTSRQAWGAGRRETPFEGGRLVEYIEATEDPNMPLVRVREEYRETGGSMELVNRHAWCADRLVVAPLLGEAAPETAWEDRLRALGFEPLPALPFSPVRSWLLPEVTLDAAGHWESELAEFGEEAGLIISRDPILYPVFTTPDDARFPEQWALAQIRASGGWDITTGDPEVIVAVLDTGLHQAHEDFYSGSKSNLWMNPAEPVDGVDNDGNGLVDDVHGWDFVNETGIRMVDTHGHGTMVSGILGAYGNNATGISGVAWRVRILPMRAGVSSFPNSVLAQAMDYVTDLRRRGYPVVATSNSYGYYPSENPDPSEWAESEVLGHAIERAREAGVLVITASGNGGQNSDNPYTRHFYPSDAPHHNVISVNALDTAGTLWRGSNHGAESVDLAAPGLNILTTHKDGGYIKWGGTSMATPHVSGAAALLGSLRPDLGVAWSRALILGSAAWDSSLEGKVTTGGALDVAALLELASLPLEEGWKRLYWTEAELAAMDFSWEDNPDADAWLNLEELAYGGNPGVADSVAAFTIGQAAFQRGRSGREGILVTLRYRWSPLADDLVSRFFEYARDSRGPWIPAIPGSHELESEDASTGIRLYEAQFLLPHSPAFIRIRLEPGEQHQLRGWGRAAGPGRRPQVMAGGYPAFGR